jgi:FkbM family methyltransferase
MNVDIYGKNFEVASEPADFWGWVSEGRYDGEWAILNKLLRPEHVFLDLGAWVGSHSLFASTIAQRVVAVEPDPVAFRILQENVALNGNTIEPVRVAVGNEGTLTLGSGLLGASTTRLNPSAGAGIGAWEPGQQFDIESVTLRRLVGTHAIEGGALFIKIDVEGAEEQIFQDFEFFEQHRPTVYLELHPWWWKDEPKAWESIRRVAALYKNVINLQMKPVDLLTVRPRSIVLTDAAL